MMNHALDSFRASICAQLAMGSTTSTLYLLAISQKDLHPSPICVLSTKCRYAVFGGSISKYECYRAQPGLVPRCGRDTVCKLRVHQLFPTDIIACGRQGATRSEAEFDVILSLLGIVVMIIYVGKKKKKKSAAPPHTEEKSFLGVPLRSVSRLLNVV